MKELQNEKMVARQSKDTYRQFLENQIKQKKIWEKYSHKQSQNDFKKMLNSINHMETHYQKNLKLKK